ncbi:MAG: LysM peptidoglycan-binding domain-containing protein [Sphingobacteriales bacterium]|nr:MAG: LysM peptidoglycan-binding domain-containing protein [Sphingobacteriales bacterium]
MKRIISYLLLSFPLFAAAQKTHTVAAKESFYSIGRLYNVHPKELASYNNISFEKGLSVGQTIKIPSGTAPMPNVPAPTAAAPVVAAPVKTETPKAQPVKAGSNPIYHTVAAKEGLYGISKRYNASIADIKKWNNLSSDGLTIGANLIVGYGAGNSKAAEQPVVTKQVPEVKEPVVVATETKPISVKEQPKPVVKEVAVERTSAGFNGGYFKAFYNQQLKEKSNSTQDKGEGSIFKSTSGWDDGKYYCLHNTAPAGSFVKVTNNANGKAVYAKVLDLIPDLKQNNGIIIRISNAAASELGVNGADFDCTLNY